jgi:ATP-binding cassette, subfamily B, bacterial
MAQHEAAPSAGSIFKRFTSYYQPWRKLFYCDLACAIVFASIDLAFPQLLNYCVQVVFVQPAADIIASLGVIAAVVAAMYLVRCGCRYYITTWGHIMGINMETEMRRDLFEQYQRLSFSYYDRNNTGEMMSKLISDLFDISEFAHHGPETILISVLKISGAFVLLLCINVPLTLILFAVACVLAGYLFTQNRRMKGIFMTNREKIAEVNSQLQDSLGGIRVVKSFGNEAYENEKFAQSNHEFRLTKVDSYRAMGRYFSGHSLFEGFLYLVVLVGGGFFIAQGTLQASALLIYVIYIKIFLAPIEELINFTETFQKGYAGFRRFVEVLMQRPDIVQKKDAFVLREARGEIVYDDVRFSYDGEHEVLKGLSFTIPVGHTVALVGPSGGGKTTTCSLLPRFYDVTGGRVTVDGYDLRDLDLASLRDNIGIVQQDVYLFDGSIRDNIAYGKPDASFEEIVTAAKRANIHDYISGLDEGYDTFAGERGVRLSGGQKQRIAIARVFLKDPRILILDEATSALDNESERFVQASLEELTKGRSVMVIAHRLSTIRNADEIVVVSEGRVQERGTHHDLLDARGVYARYYQMQFEGLED